MERKSPLDQVRNISQLLDEAEANAFDLKHKLHVAVQSALAMSIDETELKLAANLSDFALERIKGIAETPSIGYSFRGSEKSVTHDEMYKVPIQRFNSIAEIEWKKYLPGSRTRFIVQPAPDVLPIDFLYFPAESARLLVAFHGAEDRSTLEPPKFQYMTSLSNRQESLLFFSDSTLLTGKRINLGWLAGNKDIHIGAAVADTINALVEQKQIQETVLIGHSGGGFAAILVGARVPNSRAISVNGQSVVTRYEPWTVTNLKNEAFPETASIEDMYAKYAERLDLRLALQRREASSSFTAFANSTDQASFGRLPHFPLLSEHFNLLEDGGITSHGDSLVACTWKSSVKSGHALPGTILPFLHLTLGEHNDLDIEMSCNPLWIRN